ncbi:N-alpha-acetyltransferase 35, NatC auxiliary subunit [Coccinella septempunctata]|uniref:N-alpha-acetyltransferase 35, NatC auxiliary subunit n=1 Tax=Coccinella septempunctata TaxID=41139 RepID=UPI001D068AA5|nr:N-alpha-acetyltransferase 35, NatC auxiliary subunit [Coccinella septempunctata]
MDSSATESAPSSSEKPGMTVLMRQKNHVYNWNDITNEFMGSVKDLALGELLHDDMFGLFEAMSAIEMMDPKMDAGMMCNRGFKHIMDFDEQVKQNILKLKDFTSEERIGIIDTTLACIVSWLEGHSLAQTVFINLYLHKPYMIEDRIMKVFSLSVYKLVEILKDYIHKAMVYEEEDFQPMQYGYYLVPEISEQRMSGMLREIEEELSKKLKSSDNAELIQAEHSRIKFIKALYQSLLSLRKENQLNNVDNIRLLNTALDMLQHVKNTVDFGIEGIEDGKSSMLGFEPMINQRLLPPTFPRYTKIKPKKEALIYFEEMLDRLKIVCRLSTTNGLNQVLDFFIEYSKTGPCILSRSALQLVYPVNNSKFMKEQLRDAVKSFIAPPSLTVKSLQGNTQAKQYVDSFLTHCVRPFSNFLQLCGHNRARQRDKLAHLLEDFSNLQDEAERVDAFLHNIAASSNVSRQHLACFGTWILYHTLRIMIMYLLTGFELQLYIAHEFYYIYWYLYEFLYGWLISALTRADSFLVENDLMNDTNKQKNANKKKPKHKKKPRPYMKDIAYYQALQNMCGGYYKALLAFRFEGKLQVPNPQFDCEQVRYEHRFAPFQNLLTPPPVQYAEFREMTSLQNFQHQPVDSTYLYIGGCKHFHQARQLLETIPQESEVVELIKICKTNFIVLKLLAGGHKKDSTNPPEFVFDQCKYFPIIKLV